MAARSSYQKLMHDFFSKVIKRLLSLSSFYILVEKMATPELRQGCRLISFTMALAQVGAWYSEKNTANLKGIKNLSSVPDQGIIVEILFKKITGIMIVPFLLTISKSSFPH